MDAKRVFHSYLETDLLFPGDSIMTIQKAPTIVVIFGGLGNLAWRKSAPALYNLFFCRSMPNPFAGIGLDARKDSTLEIRRPTESQV
jgi:glucose-6-phosphate 1-dehydrogenase